MQKYQNRAFTPLTLRKIAQGLETSKCAQFVTWYNDITDLYPTGQELQWIEAEHKSNFCPIGMPEKERKNLPFSIWDAKTLRQCSETKFLKILFLNQDRFRAILKEYGENINFKLMFCHDNIFEGVLTER